MQDEDHDDGLGGRTRDRREFTEFHQGRAQRLLELPELRLVHPAVPEVVRRELVVARNATSHRARNRSVRRADLLISQLEEDELAELERFLDEPAPAVHPEVSAWIDRLGRDPDLVTELAVEHPEVEAQRVRQLARNLGRPALRERARAALVELLGSLVLAR